MKKAFTFKELLIPLLNDRVCQSGSLKENEFHCNAQNDKKSAFTLAEVLITLGIIGIVAALTIPGVIEGYKKKETVAKLQKAYTLLNQALKLSEAKYEEYEYWESGANFATAEDYLKMYWTPHFKVAAYCYTPQKCGYKSNGPYKQLNGTADSSTFVLTSYRLPFATVDGTVYTISVRGGTDDSAQSVIWVDLNGSKDPNQYGKDIFFFERVAKKGILPSGWNREEDNILENCSISGYGNFCAAKIMRDGWEIKDDYPW